MTLHPSEWYSEDAHVSVIELKRDVNLLFMVREIHAFRILSALNDFIGTQRGNMIKMDCEKVKKWIPYLQQESLDGWFSSIENKTAVEFAILNDPNILDIVECEPIIFNWNNSTYNNNNALVPKKWGSVYPIHSQTHPISLIINSRFQPQIENYIRRVSDEDSRGTAFSILLENANITYVNSRLHAFNWPV